MLSIQLFSQPEYPLLFDMVQRYLQEIAPHSPEAEAVATENTPLEEVFSLAKPGSFPWRAQVDHHTIGFALIQLSEDEQRDTGALLTDFYIEPAQRQQGYGRAFVEALRKWMKQEGVGRVDLSVRGDTPGAYAFWKAVGFQVDSYRMSLDL